MRRAPWSGLATSLAALGVAVVACHHTNGAPPGRADVEAADTIVGTVQVVGVDAFPKIVLVPDTGNLAATLIGPPSLRHLDGLRISVVGRSVGSQFTVKQFTVAAAGGLAATDGRLVADGSTLYIVTSDSVHHPLVNPSPNLWAHVGSRVWVSGSLDHEPVAYGIIK